MKKQLKKLLCAALSLSMIAGSIVLPTMASAETTPMVEGDTVLNEWKFDFGSADDVADGYTAVTPDRNYEVTNDYGFLGIDENSYKLGNRLDGFGNQQGQVIQLAAGGGNGLNDAIGSVGADAFENSGEEYYPVRFALKVADEQFFRVKATVTTLDPTKDAEVSLYTARKHPIIKNTTVAAGETKTVEFSIRTTPIYYQKSDPQGSIADGMVNVCVLGENSALAALEIQQVETLPTMWVLGDSTVTDGNANLPYFDLQNYTGVGTGLTMYLPRTMAMVNEGEGGLAANDSLHFNMVTPRIKAGDYLYVEYGHNHKSDGPTGYLSCLEKYYNACQNAIGGPANLIIVSPIERINQWDSATSTYTHSLRDFATTGEQYVADKVAAGATNIAYVDLNQYSLDFYNKITADNGNDSNAIKFYFQTGKNGGTDTTHPNDLGAEHLAYEFMKAAQAVTDPTQKAVLDGFLANMTAETPTLVAEEIVAGGLGGEAWPPYIWGPRPTYPVAIDDVEVNEAGNVVSVDVTTRQAQIVMGAYGIIVITVTDAEGNEKGKIYAVDQVDNSVGYGPQEIVNFRGDVTIAEGDTYSAIVMQAVDAGSGLAVDEEANQPYSTVYTPTDVAQHLITDEDKEGNEDFDYYGAVYEGDTPSSLEAFNGWTQRGSAGKTLTLGVDGTRKYANIISDGAKNGAANQGSFYIAKDLETPIGTTGRYVISADIKYLSGGGMAFRFVTGNTDKDPWGTETLTAFTIATDGKVTVEGVEAGQVSALGFTNVKYILDMDYGKASVSVDGGEPVEVDVANYQTTSTEIAPAKLTGFMFEANKVAAGIQVSNLTVGKMKDQELPEYTLAIAASNDEWGTVEILPLPTPTPEPTSTPEPTPTPDVEAPTPTDGDFVVTPEPTDAVEPTPICIAPTVEPTETTDPDLTESPSPEETGTPAVDPISGSATDNVYTWSFGTAGASEVVNYSDDYAAIRVATGEGGSITAEGITMLATGDDAGSTAATTGRYIFIKPAYSGTVKMTVASSRKGRLWVTDNGAVEFDAVDLSTLGKGDTAQAVFNETSEATKEISFAVEAGHVYSLHTYTYPSTESITFSGMTYELTTEPVTVLSGDGVTVTVTPGKAVVASDAALTAVLVEAVYEDGVLKSVKTTDIALAEAGSKEVEVAEGSKLMLWDSLSGMKPLVGAEVVPVATPTPEPTPTPTPTPTPVPTMPPTAETMTAEMNTAMTIKAEAKEGYVFMGWRTLEDDTLVSSEAEYTFRLREDTNLIANFVKEPGVEDVVSYSVGATNSFIKGAAGSTTTMKLVDPVDAAGTPLFKVTNADAAWSCEEPGVTVDASGVVTVGDSFTMDANSTKDVTIKAVLNGIEKSYTITLYSYAYYEAMTDGATNYDGLLMTIAGKTTAVFPGASTSQKYTMAAPVALDKPTTIVYSNAWSGQNTCGQLRTLNFQDSAGNTIFSMYYSWGGLFVGGTELAGAVAKDTWSDITIAIDPATSTVTVTSGANSATTTLAAGAADLAGIQFVSAGSVPGPEARALGISSITISQ